MKPIDVHEPGRTRFSIIADDLTGACDSAVAFAERGLPVEVVLEEGTGPSVDGVWAISTESRDLPEDAAVERTGAAMVAARQAAEVFKKVDSVFRGNTFAEIRAAIEGFPCELVVMSPAYPAMGRVVRDGLLRIEGGGESRTIDLCEGLHRAGVRDVSLRRVGHDAGLMGDEPVDRRKADRRLVLWDAESMADLHRTVKEARDAARSILWIGSGGLAQALASEIPQAGVARRVPPAEGIVVLFVGSDHSVTKRQIEALHGAAKVCEVRIEDFSGVPAETQFVVLKVHRESTTVDQIRLAMTLLRPHGIACCVLTGGDTAAMVCRALEVGSLRLVEEFAPGLPEGIAMGGALDQIPVILKSGGFGKDDVLWGLSKRLMNRKEPV